MLNLADEWGDCQSVETTRPFRLKAAAACGQAALRVIIQFWEMNDAGKFGPLSCPIHCFRVLLTLYCVQHMPLSSSSILLSLPAEIRLTIYDIFLNNHTQIRDNIQPSNSHLYLLQTCTQIASEATCLRTYLSLAHELQIASFLANADSGHLDRIKIIDVANDGRIVTYQNQVCLLVCISYSNVHVVERP